MNYLVELEAPCHHTNCYPQTFQRHEFLFSDDAHECARALADAYGEDRVACYWFAPAFVREPDGTCVDESGWESMSLAELEMQTDEWLAG